MVSILLVVEIIDIYIERESVKEQRAIPVQNGDQ